MMGCVYIVRNRINGKCYVGKTMGSLLVRRKQHERAACQGIQCYFYRALRYYGLDVFDWSVLFESDWEEELFWEEVGFIATLGTKRPNGYNLTDGGEGCLGPVPEVRAKMSVAKVGRKQTPESIVKRAASNTGKKRTPETKAKIGAAHRGMRHTPEARMKIGIAGRGRKHTLETRLRIGAALKGRKHSAEALAKMKGKKRTPEQLAKMRGRKHTPETCAKIGKSNRDAWLAKKALAEAKEDAEPTE